MKILIGRLSVSDTLNQVFIKENILPAINGKTLGDCSEIHHRFSPSFLIFGFPMGPVQFLLEDPPLSRLSIILYSPPLPVPYWYFFKKSIMKQLQSRITVQDLCLFITVSSESLNIV